MNQFPQEIADLLNSGACVAFIGSGPSAGIYYSWKELVNYLCQRCGVGTNVTDDRNTKALLAAAEEAKIADENAYYRYIGEHFSRIPATNPIYPVLLSIPFKSFITVNLDPLLYKAAQTSKQGFNHLMSYPDLDRDVINDRTLYHIHGIIHEGGLAEPGRIVLSESEFEVAYKADNTLRHFLIPTFKKESVFFIGCRLLEPVMEKIFDICRAQQRELESLGGGKPLPKYILLPRVEITSAGIAGPEPDLKKQAEAENNEVEYYKNLGIDVIRYDPIDKHHTGLRKLFEPLARLRVPPIIFGFNSGGGT